MVKLISVANAVNYTISFYAGLTGGFVVAFVLGQNPIRVGLKYLPFLILWWFVGLVGVMGVEWATKNAEKSKRSKHFFASWRSKMEKIDGKRLEKATEIVSLAIVGAWVSMYFNKVWSIPFPGNIILLIMIGIIATGVVYRILSK